MRITLREDMLCVEGEVDLSNAHRLRAAIEEQRGDGGRTRVEMSGVTFIDSSGFHAIQRAASASEDGVVVLVNVPRQIVRLIGILGLDRLPNLEIEGGSDG